MLIPTQFRYFVQPEFHHHAHIHRNKIQALRNAGLEARVVSIVSLRTQLRRWADYHEAASRLGVQVIGVPHGRMASVAMTFHLVRALARGDVICQVLRSAWPKARFLRRWAQGRGRRFRILLELEGDFEAEADYLSAHPYHGGFYDRIVEIARRQAPEVSRMVGEADGLVLMSEEHLALWQQRLGRPVKGVAMPALFDPDLMRFDPAARESVRAALGLGRHIALVYVGNVLCSWQKFGAICRLLRTLQSEGFPVMLLAIIHRSDHPIAEDFVGKYKISETVRLLASEPAEVHEYLSAADVGVFLRDDHLMNRIVTSAKLGEYLACGLPIITTGAAALYHEFVREHEAGVFLPDPKMWGPEQTSGLKQLLERSAAPGWRARLASLARDRFTGPSGPLADYVRFVLGDGERLSNTG